MADCQLEYDWRAADRSAVGIGADERSGAINRKQKRCWIAESTFWTLADWKQRVAAACGEPADVKATEELILLIAKLLSERRERLHWHIRSEEDSQPPRNRTIVAWQSTTPTTNTEEDREKEAEAGRQDASECCQLPRQSLFDTNVGSGAPEDPG